MQNSDEVLQEIMEIVGYAGDDRDELLFRVRHCAAGQVAATCSMVLIGYLRGVLTKEQAAEFFECKDPDGIENTVDVAAASAAWIVRKERREVH